MRRLFPRLKLKTVLKLTIGSVLLVALVATVDPKALASVFERASGGFLIVAFSLFVAQASGEAIRFLILYYKFGLQYFVAFRLYLVGVFVGNFVPELIGAAAYQIYALSRLPSGKKPPLALYLLLRANGLAVNFVCGLAAAIALAINIRVPYSDVISAETLGLVVSLGLVTLLGCIWFLRTKRFTRARLSMLEFWVESKKALKELPWEHVAALTFMGIAILAARAGIYCATVAAFGSAIGFGEGVLISSVVTIAMLLPISVGGLGVREVSAAGLLVAFGVDQPEAVAIVLVNRGFLWIASALGGVLFLRADKPRLVEPSKTQSNAL